ncbi:hypothetical protein QCF72_gp52 [Escherichia phage vB_EcoS_fPoEco01]|uniref:hypothetical protein n=1 Tax=Escherichia phage vB_EcoS_fFiEco02 TaxID=2762426 RepID=UPI0018619F37|nr:hypothetical protein QCF71_gp55 [Escherichia phage vB_EcoS_fFiEco02]YP_010749108.1 hypothetical protein QCF72_gp52 [Escherichia phage vB_EcoS_fPoEco01]QNO11615.1 hypothetical protein FE2_054 [Escherichia phage vB_EcoS_fFiEco02]QNO11838.1 hypothetical protein PE1_051 [Escherichia phage vB_EcoS_fPoEco01]
MFRKGQLVKAVDYYYSIVETESVVFPGTYRVRFLVKRLGAVDWFREDELTLIGNNFKFKGAK